MTTKVYAVYSIPKSPEYRLEALFKTKEMAKSFIKEQKKMYHPPQKEILENPKIIYDIQIEEIFE